jgi:23S rRNA (pseudouridine1915-N3)-methyltransferase
MKIKLLFIGKENLEELQIAFLDYVSKINNYIFFEIEAISYIKKTKSLPVEQQKKMEGEMFFKKIAPQDIVVLLDEHSNELTSVQLSKFIQQLLNSGSKSIVFIIGGVYGFSEQIFERANHKISMSKMTFPHKLVRLFFVEQVYRAFTILKGEPYHHE